jgi:hypothetical protein
MNMRTVVASWSTLYTCESCDHHEEGPPGMVWCPTCQAVRGVEIGAPGGPECATCQTKIDQPGLPDIDKPAE